MCSVYDLMIIIMTLFSRYFYILIWKLILFIWLYIYYVWSCNDSTVLYGALESVCACYGAIKIVVINAVAVFNVRMLQSLDPSPGNECWFD